MSNHDRSNAAISGERAPKRARSRYLSLCDSGNRLSDNGPTVATALSEALYHIRVRGKNRKAIYRAEEDRREFLGHLAHAIDRYHFMRVPYSTIFLAKARVGSSDPPSTCLLADRAGRSPFRLQYFRFAKIEHSKMENRK